MVRRIAFRLEQSLSNHGGQRNIVDPLSVCNWSFDVVPLIAEQYEEEKSQGRKEGGKEKTKDESFRQECFCPQRNY